MARIQADLHLIREASQDDKHGGKMGGETEIDETYIGGAARNVHKGRRARALEDKGGGYSHKVGVQGILERGGKIRAMVVEGSGYARVHRLHRRTLELSGGEQDDQRLD